MLSPLRRAALLATTASLLLAGPALAAEYTVDPDADTNGSCGGSDTVCSTIAGAITQATGADTITIVAGDYAERPTVPAGKDGLTIKGAGANTRIAGNVGTGDIFTIESQNVTVSLLAVTGAPDSGSSIAIPGSATLNGVVVTRNEGTNSPAILLSGGASTIRNSVVFNQAQGAAVTSEAAGLELTDSVLLSSSAAGLHLLTGADNRMIRSTALSTAEGGAGVLVESPSDDSTAKKLVMRSAVGAGPAAGVKAHTRSAAVFSQAGDIELDIDHSTLLGANGILALAEANGGALPPPLGTNGPVGDITAVVNSSIVHGAVRAERTDNTATVTLNRSDVPATSQGDGTVNRSADSMFTEDAKLFAPGKVNLRTDAPVIDKGAAPAAGNDRDFEGQPRVVGAASDIGADEFVNRAPAAAIRVDNATPPASEPVTFDASGSKDPEQGAGGAITEYRWDFGDGTRQTTSVPAVQHAYAATGEYQASVTVVDNLGAQSAPAAVKVTPGAGVDRVAPVVQILQPVDGQRLKLRGKRRKGSRKRRPVQLTILGGVTDATGIKQVDVALRLVKRKGRRALPAGRCAFYNGKRRFKKADCDEPAWLKVSRTRNVWRFRSRKGYRLPPGRYELRARGTDIVGNVSTVFSKDAKTLVGFRVK